MLKKMNNIVNPMKSLRVTRYEMVFMLASILFNIQDIPKISDSSIKVIEKLQTEISEDMHDYYTKEMKLEKYADRLTKLMSIMESCIGIWRHVQEKVGVWALIKLLFDWTGIVYDFGIEVGGIVSINYTIYGQGTGALGLAFTEAKNYIGYISDNSVGTNDGALYVNFTNSGDYTYTMPNEKLRGGFRYMTVFLVSENDGISANIQDISLEIAYQPTWSNLQAYQGYFHSDDDLLNRIWYAGAYTLQTTAIPANTGRTFVTSGWSNNGSLGSGETYKVDGAKRDRSIWSGDMGISIPSTFYSLGDLNSVKNSLQAIYDNQAFDGGLPYAGPPANLPPISDTYHMWAMIGTYAYVLYTNDTDFLAKNYGKYQKAMAYSYGKVQEPGLMVVTGLGDWARMIVGANMTEAQMILYRALVTGAQMSEWMGDESNADIWRSRAEDLKNAIMKYCWDEEYGAFKDFATNTFVHPQDANSLAVVFGVVSANSSEAQRISERLTENWTPYGPEPPELPGNISPFITGFEIQAHLIVGQTERAMDLIRLTWGWYLNHPNGTGSTTIEGMGSDGTFGYLQNWWYVGNPSSVSHSHGWGTGPTSAMTEFVVGLKVTGVLGTSWKLAPHFGNLTRAEGGFTTKLGRFQARWTRTINGYTATCNTPIGSKGDLILPVLQNGDMPKIALDGRMVNATWFSKNVNVTETILVQVDGGNHTIEVSTFPTLTTITPIVTMQPISSDGQSHRISNLLIILFVVLFYDK